MKRSGVLFFVALFVIGLAPSAHSASFAGQTLRLQVWPGADALAIQKNVIDPFKKETGANVVVEEGNTSASIAKARAQKNDPQLDVIFLDDIGVLTLLREGILEKLDMGRMPHAKEIHPSYIVGDGYGIGIFNYITTILYNTQQVSPAPTSWEDLWNPKYKGKVLITPATHTQGLLLTVMAATLNGGGMDKIAAAWPKLQQLKPNVHSLVTNRALGAELMNSGEAVLAVDIPHYYKPYIERKYPIAMTVGMKEGFFSITGSACLVKGGKASRELAYAFLDRALTAEAQTGMARDLWYGPTNSNAKLTAEERKFMVSTPDEAAKAIRVDRLKLLELRPTIIEEWNKIMPQ